MIQRITEVKEPKVGRFYLVPCVWMKNKWQQKGAWWPVIGPWHVDPEINFHRPHYHYDVRFLLKRQCRESGGPMELVRVHAPCEEPPFPPVEWRKRKMVREMPDFPRNLWSRATETGNKNKIVKTLEKTYGDVRMKCLTCPHKGMPLEGLPVKDGMVVCNGHGLRWNLKTGRMVVR